MKPLVCKTIRLCLFASCLLSATASWATSYSYTAINGPGNVPAYVGALNDSGQIPGYYNAGGIYKGFIYAGGSYTSIDDPAGVNGTAVGGISNSGTVVGSYYDAQSASHGFVFNGSTYTTLDHPGAVGTDLLSVNSGGDIVGDYYTVSNPNPNDYIYFLYSKGVFTDVIVPGAYLTIAVSINDLGQISGEYQDTSSLQTTHGFIRSANQVVTVLNYPGDPSAAVSTSATGQTVGLYIGGANPYDNSYEYQNGVFSAISTPYDTTDAVDVLGVNKNGLISGTRYPGDLGLGYGFLLTPVPEPGSTALFIAGLFGLGGLRLKSRAQARIEPVIDAGRRLWGFDRARQPQQVRAGLGIHPSPDVRGHGAGAFRRATAI